MRIAYMRPTEEDPDCAKQQILLKEHGCEKIIAEEHASPKKREQLEKLLNQLKNEDKIIVERLYTLADSTRHLVDLLEKLDGKGAFLISLKEEIDTSKGSAYSFQKIVHCLAEFQRDAISEKTKAGLSEAKQKGAVSGRPRKPDENVQKAIAMYNSKNFTLAEIKEQTGISKSTLYRYLEY